MNRHLNTLVIALSLLSAGAALAREPRMATLSNFVARVQQLQDQLALGNKAAHSALGSAMKSVSAAIAAADPEIWKQDEERNAAAIYLFSGGSARELLKIAADEDISGETKDILLGALAYASGHRESAKKILGHIDPRAADPRVAGQLAYVQSDLLAEDEPVRALASLDLARALAPAGLVEESALRRGLFLTAELKDVDRFIFLSKQYMRRYARSYYYSNFRTSLEFNLERIALAASLEDLSKLKSLGASFPPDERRSIGRIVARAALFNGRYAAAAEAAKAVLDDEGAEAANDVQARLYSAAARVMVEDYDKAYVDLQTLPTQQLKERDRLLLTSALQVAVALHSPTPATGEAPNDIELKTPVPSAEATIASAEAALKGADGELTRPPAALR